MGRVNILGLGQVDIEGETPNEQEIEAVSYTHLTLPTNREV